MRTATLALALLALALLAPLALHAQTWTPQTSGTTADLNDVHFLSETTGFAVGEGGLLLATADGGTTWTSRSISGDDLQAIAFNAAGTVGVIVTDDGAALRTVDGGANWTFAPTGMGDGRAVAWGTETVVFAAGRDGAGAVSTDAGATWTPRPTGSADRTEGLAAWGADRAWAVGRSGEIRFTANAGASWTAQASGVGTDLNDAQMLDATVGYAVGSNDVVLKTTDGGTTWTNVSNGNAGGDGLFFLDAATGWSVDDAGEIWFTANGGASWALQPSGTAASFNRVHFPSASRGWAVGDAGVIVTYRAASTAGEARPGMSPLALSAPAPNPATGYTAVMLTLDAPQDVAVGVYDALGRRVALLHDGPLTAGAHALSLHAARLAPGVYAVRAAGGGVAQTRRLVVVR